MKEWLFDDDHPDVANNLNNLALLYDSKRMYFKAESLYQQSLEMRKRLFGDDHLDVATSLNNLAFLYLRKGRYSEAEPLYQKALEIFEQTLGIEHPNTITIRNHLESLRSNVNTPSNLLSKLWIIFRMKIFSW